MFATHARSSLVFGLVASLVISSPALAGTRAPAPQPTPQQRVQQLEARAQAAAKRWNAGLDAATRDRLRIAALERNAGLLATLLQLEEQVLAGKLAPAAADVQAQTTMIRAYEAGLKRLLANAQLSLSAAKELRAYPRLKYAGRTLDSILDELSDQDEELNTSFPGLAFVAVIFAVGIAATGVGYLVHWLVGDDEALDEVSPTQTEETGPEETRPELSQPVSGEPVRRGGAA